MVSKCECGRQTHLLNILKIICVDDWDETVMDRIYHYLESRRVIDTGYGRVSQENLDRLEDLLASVRLERVDSRLPEEYEYRRIE